MSKQPIGLSDLTPEQRNELFAQMQQEQNAKSEAIANNRKAYKSLVNETVPVIFEELKKASLALTIAKNFCYRSVQELLALKKEVFGWDDEQLSHTFTTAEGLMLIIGHRTTDGWDDTVNVGIDKVNNCLEGFVKDDNSKALVKQIRQLLQKDTKGNLKATRVFQLRKLAEDSKNSDLLDAIDIIEKAHQPNRSKRFVSLRYKGDDGGFIDLPLSITDAEIDEESLTAPVMENNRHIIFRDGKTMYPTNI